MNEIRKVLVELIETARRYSTGVMWNDEREIIDRAESLLATMPAVGAWYPSVDECCARITPGRLGSNISTDCIIRAAIDLFRERGGQVGGEVVGWQWRMPKAENVGARNWSHMTPTERLAFDGMDEAEIAKYEIRELVVRGSGTSQPAVAGDARVVAWFTDDYLTDKSATTYDPVVADRWRGKGWKVTPLYTHNAAAAKDAT